MAAFGNLKQYSRLTTPDIFYNLLGTSDGISLMSEFLPDKEWHVINQESPQFTKIQKEFESISPIKHKEFTDEGVEIMIYMLKDGYAVDAIIDD